MPSRKRPDLFRDWSELLLVHGARWGVQLIFWASFGLGVGLAAGGLAIFLHHAAQGLLE